MSNETLTAEWARLRIIIPVNGLLLTAVPAVLRKKDS